MPKGRDCDGIEDSARRKKGMGGHVKRLGGGERGILKLRGKKAKCVHEGEGECAHL